MKQLCIVACLVLLGGCSSLPPLPSPAPGSLQAWEQRDRDLAELTTWSIQGRFSLIAESESWTGMLSWQRHGDRYAIQLSSPLGQGMIRLSGASNAAILELGDGRRYQDASAETLFKDRLGWEFPLTSLLHWITGRPQRAEEYSFELTPDGKIIRLHQQRWIVLYQQYYDKLTPELPRKISLSNSDLRIKLVVDRWESTPAT